LDKHRISHYTILHEKSHGVHSHYTERLHEIGELDRFCNVMEDDCAQGLAGVVALAGLGTSMI